MTDRELALGLEVDPGDSVEAAVTAAIKAATDAGELGPVHAGAAALARSLARNVDRAHTPSSVVGASKELRTVLKSLGLDRASRGELAGRQGGPDDPFDALTRAMSAATSDPPPP